VGGSPKSLARQASTWSPSAGIFGPTTGLDPDLFDEHGRIRPDVRHCVMTRLDQCIRTDSGLAGSDWQDWTRVYLLGGAVSEWAGPRPNGTARDLDVIVAVDLPQAQRHSAFGGMDAGTAASALNTAFQRHFNDDHWRPSFGGVWSLTGFCNQRAWDVTAIRPYAAYDLTHSRWAVRPPHLPEHSVRDFDPAVIAHAQAVLAEARAVLRMPEPLRTREARDLWEHVHAHRCVAFSEEGSGWQDVGNVDEKMLAYAPRNVWGKIRELAHGRQVTAAAQGYLLNPYHGNPEFGGRPEWSHIWFHGTKGTPDFGTRRKYSDEGQRAELPPEQRKMNSGWTQPNQHLGIHFSPLHEVAHKFVGSASSQPGALVHARLRFDNPAVFPSEEHLDIALAHYGSQHYPHWHDDKLNSQMAWNYGDQEGTHRDFSQVPENPRERWHLRQKAQSLLSWHPHMPEILSGFRQHLAGQGHHGIVYGNRLEGPYETDATQGGDASLKYIRKRENWPAGHPYSFSAIAHPDDIEVTHVEHVAPWRGEPQGDQRTWEDVSDSDEPDEVRDKVLDYHRQHGGALPGKTAAAEASYYHGTRYNLTPGGVLEGGAKPANNPGVGRYEHVYMHPSPMAARAAGSLAYDEAGYQRGQPNVYEVEPLDSPERDPFTSGAVRSKRARVLRKVDPFTEPDPEAEEDGLHREAAAERKFYHGTATELRPGGSIEPWDAVDRYPESSEDHVYMSPDRNHAWGYALERQAQGYGKARVYEVSPWGGLEHDPMHPGGDSWRATGADVVREVPFGEREGAAPAGGQQRPKRTPGNAMVYLDVPHGTVQPYQGQEGGHHIALAYLPRAIGDEDFAKVVDRAREAATRFPPLRGTLGGHLTFPPGAPSDKRRVAVVPAVIPGVHRLQQEFGEFDRAHYEQYTPHVTRAQLTGNDPDPEPHPQVPVSFTHVHVRRGEEVHSFPLTGLSPAERATRDSERVRHPERYKRQQQQDADTRMEREHRDREDEFRRNEEATLKPWARGEGDWPRQAAAEDEEPDYYHVSPFRLPRGTILRPGVHMRGNFDESTGTHVHMTSDVNRAEHYRYLLWEQGHPEQHMYNVVPHGPVEPDPADSQAVRTQHPVSVEWAMDPEATESDWFEPGEGHEKTAAGYDLKPRSGMIYLDLPPGTVRPVPGGVDDHHITLVYLGSGLSDEKFAEACRRTQAAAAECPPMEGVLRGIGIFPPSKSSDGKVPAFVPAYVGGVGRLRRLLEDLSASEHKDWRPHCTLTYMEEGDDLPEPHPAVPLRFTHVHVKRGDDIRSYPLGGGMSREAAQGEISYSHHEEGHGRHRFDARAGDRLAGYAKAVEHPGHIALDEVFVQPEDRGQGIASRLVDSVTGHFPGREVRLKPEPYGHPYPPGLDENQLRGFYRAKGFGEAEEGHMIRRASRGYPVTEIGPLYHGTTEERARRVLSQGFQGGEDRNEGIVYLAHTPELAASFAEGRVKKEGGAPAVLRVERVRGVSAEHTGYSSPALNREAGAHYMDKHAEVLVLDPSVIHGVSRYPGDSYD
jgi:2'-5' RNA ligase/predicted GNAT family acetyltransferase